MKGKKCLLMKQRHDAFIQEIKDFKSEFDWASLLKDIREQKLIIECKNDESRLDFWKSINEKNSTFTKADNTFLKPYSSDKMYFTRSRKSASFLSQQISRKFNHLINLAHSKDITIQDTQW